MGDGYGIDEMLSADFSYPRYTSEGLELLELAEDAESSFV
jgi:hypothetical protein